MAFTNTKWEFSDVTTEEIKSNFARPEEGDRYLKITDAFFDESEKKYTLTMLDLGNEAQFNLSYWLFTADEDNNLIPSVYNRNALVELGKALAGEEIGIPNPDSVIGGVVMGHITLKPSKKDPTKKYARCYKYSPVPYDVAITADIDQYSTDGPVESE